MRPYWAYYKKALQAHLAYTGSLFTALLSQALGFAITVLIWRGAWKGSGEEAKAFFAYLTLAFLCNFSLSIFLERSVGERISEGLIATDLIKPVDFQNVYLFQSLSDATYQSFIAAAVALAGALVLGPALLPAGALALGLGLLSWILAFFVQYGISFLFTQGLFITFQNYGVFTTRMVLHQAFAGIFAPLSVFPPQLKLVADALPFQHVVYTPTAIWLGRLAGAQAQHALGLQVLWAAGLFLAGRLVFGRIRRNLVVQGG